MNLGPAILKTSWNNFLKSLTQPSLSYLRDTNIMKQNVSSPDDVVVQEAGSGRGPGWRHQEPVINSSIINNLILRLNLCQSTWDRGAPQTSNCNEIAVCSTLCWTHFETFWPTLMPPWALLSRRALTNRIWIIVEHKPLSPSASQEILDKMKKIFSMELYNHFSLWWLKHFLVHMHLNLRDRQSDFWRQWQ